MAPTDAHAILHPPKTAPTFSTAFSSNLCELKVVQDVVMKFLFGGDSSQSASVFMVFLDRRLSVFVTSALYCKHYCVDFPPAPPLPNRPWPVPAVDVVCLSTSYGFRSLRLALWH
ncbi:hypothetical protein BT96DRAFT_1010363 [Gymnopus androsaceus JB14]|uniref:Uncharacterized protein n=1 Tax=Gymnopus androsaceus JB14 TaxID=1447944 RepID=A0A6A4GAS2_9AGAR|nr:hypothetical protein BT96DRAFT_1010363 [Gymnopus androsaceus JB14]